MQVGYQYGDTNDFYVGDQRDDAAAGVGPPHRTVNLFNLGVGYGLSDRVTLALSLPFLSTSGGNWGGTAEAPVFTPRHASGLGDMSFGAEYWLTDPTRPSKFAASVGLGFMAPTGSDHVSVGRGDARHPIDEAFQLGTGGWYTLFRAQATLWMAPRFAAYGSGFYGLSLSEHSNVMQHGTLGGVPDTYSGRLGVAYLVVLPRFSNIVLTAGGIINGITVRDIIGGGDLYWRRPGYEVYVEPGLSWTFGRNAVSISVPVRVYQNKLNSLYDLSTRVPVGADFAPFLFSATIAHRF